MAPPHDEPGHAHPELQRPPRPDVDDRHADPDTGADGRTDLLSIGLLVFFVALIGIVGALLLVPALV